MGYPTLNRGPRKFGLNDRAGDYYFDPAVAYGQYLSMWYRASDLTNLSHSQKLSTWQGFTGNATTSQSAYILNANATPPTFYTSSFGTQPGVFFNGLNNGMSLTLRQQIVPSFNAWTVIFFGRWIQGAQYQTLISDPQSSGNHWAIYNSSSMYTYEGNASYHQFNSPYNTVTKMISSVKYDTGFNVVFDGTAMSTLWSGNGRANATWFQWAGYYNGNYPFSGWWGELMVFTIPLTLPQLTELHDNYFKIKYGSDPTFV